MQNAITQFIRRIVEEAITYAVDKRTAAMLDEKMPVEDKQTTYLSGNRTREPPMDIIILGEDYWSSSGGGE